MFTIQTKREICKYIDVYILCNVLGNIHKIKKDDKSRLEMEGNRTANM